MKKLLLISAVISLFAASCQQQGVVQTSLKVNSLPAETTTAQSSITLKASGSSKPAEVPPKTQTFIITEGSGKVQNNITVRSNSSSSNYSNIQNNSTVITTSSSSSYSNIQDNSTIISNSSASSNSNSSINIHLSSSDFPVGTIGQAYSHNINFTQAGNSQLEIEFTGLPPGVGILNNGSLSSSATLTSPSANPAITLSGTPTQAGQYNVSLKLDNKNGTMVTQGFTMTIN